MFRLKCSNLTVLLIVFACIWKEGRLEIVDTLTEDQKYALKKIRPAAVKLSSEAYMKSDSYLVRWLSAFDFDVEETLDRIRQNQELRTKHKISGILGEEFPVFIQEDFPLTINSYDRLGRPVAIAASGTFNMRRMALKGQAEIMHRYGTMLLELMEVHLYQLQCSGTLNENVLPQITAIIDLAGINFKNSGCLICLAKVPRFIYMYDGNYVETVRRTYLINVPRIMESILTACIAFMSPKSQQLVHVYGLDKSEWSEVLLREIPFDQLPIAYGGGKSTPKVSKPDKLVWNWNNPYLEAIFQEYRQLNASYFGNCTSKAKAGIELDVGEDSATETTSETPHRHRHHHGENISSMHETNSNILPEFDDWIIDNSWIDEPESEEYPISSETGDKNPPSTHDHDPKQENYSENNKKIQSQVSRGPSMPKLSIFSIFMVGLQLLNVFADSKGIREI